MEEYGRVFMMMDHTSVGRSGIADPPPLGHRRRRFLGGLLMVDEDSSLLMVEDDEIDLGIPGH